MPRQRPGDVDPLTAGVHVLAGGPDYRSPFQRLNLDGPVDARIEGKSHDHPATANSENTGGDVMTRARPIPDGLGPDMGTLDSCDITHIPWQTGRNFTLVPGGFTRFHLALICVLVVSPRLCAGISTT